MGLYTQLPDTIQEVDVIIAGGKIEGFATARYKQLALTNNRRWNCRMHYRL